MNDIKGFFKQYFWLSNFHDCQVTMNDMIFPSTENAYQAAKFLANGDFASAEKLTKCTASESKRIGRTATLPVDWDTLKLEVMEDLIDQKFNQSPFKELLLATDNCYLEETNYWRDVFWGVCKGIGENNLGKLIMKKRAKLKTEVE